MVSLSRLAPGEDNPPVSGDRALPTRKLKTISGSSGGTSYVNPKMKLVEEYNYSGGFWLSVFSALLA